MSLFSRTEKKPPIHSVFGHFRKILNINNRVLGLIAGMEQALGGEYIFDRAFLKSSVADLAGLVRQDIYHLNAMTGGRFVFLFDRFEEILERLGKLIEGRPESEAEQFVISYSRLNRDMDEFVGAKNAFLAEAGNVLDIAVPEGFALTTRAYSYFLEQNDIPRKIASMPRLRPEEMATRIAGLFVEKNAPPALREAVEKNAMVLSGAGKKHLAVRSSALGEDGEKSFAGQFTSYLNVQDREVLPRCLQVMASRFSAHLLKTLPPGTTCWEYPMAVAIQTMIDAKIGGVIYTRDPSDEFSENMIISAVEGSSSSLVSGRRDSDQFFVSRRSPFSLQKSLISSGPRENELNRALSTGEEGLYRGSALLVPAQLKLLAETAMLIEKHFGLPQDIEWAIDTGGRIVILQCRRLYLSEPSSIDPELIRKELAGAPVVLSNCGHPAQLGVATGVAVYVDSRDIPDDFPVGAIAVTRTADPVLSTIIRRAAAILTEVGSPTGHLASIAREYRTPALFGCGDLRKRIKDGQFITVDVEERTIYDGHLKLLDKIQHQQRTSLEDSSEMRTLRRLLRLITPLNLKEIAGFTPENCRTMHDIIRFCHEKAVETLSHFHADSIRKSDDRVLQLPLPLKIRLVDLGGGMTVGENKEIDAESVTSLPFQAILKGMLLKGMWENEPVSLGIRDILSSAFRTPQPGPGMDAYMGENLAIIADDYVNLSLRLGYHFNVIDSFVSQDPNDNYIYFRFIGGMADAARRVRRAELISVILHSLHFLTERQGDMVIGKMKMLTPEHAASILGRLGQLIAFTRQLDVRMVDDETIDIYLQKFLEYTRMAGE